MRLSSVLVRTALSAAFLAMTSSPARAATTEITISMATPPPAPRLLGAGTVGVITGTPFLYTIPATGTRPLTFEATGLPAGLTIDATTGRISGTANTAGRYDVTLRATNAGGSDTRQVTIAVGATLALTPPMGWNSYDSFDDSVREAEFIEQAQWLVDHLQPFAWEYVVVDFRWYDPGAPGSNQNQAGINNALVMDANGRLQPDPVRFPSAANGVGFGPLAARVHAMGLKFGIHIMRGIPRRAVQANAPILGSTFVATDAANTADMSTWNSDMYGVNGGAPAGQAWYDSIVQQYAAWGVDFIKADDMIRNVAPILYHQSEVDALKRAIDKSGRSIVLSLSPGEMQAADSTDLVTNANMWRMSNDFWDRPGDLDRMFTLAASWRGVMFPGHWPDADMLPLGHLGPRCPVDGVNRDTRFTHNEQVTMISFWAVLPSPLMLGANMPMLDAWGTALLTNEEVLAVGQDGLGMRARLIGTQGMQEVWAKDLSGGRKAVGLFNHGAADVTMTASFADLGVSGVQRVRDLWRRTDLATAQGSLSAVVPFRGAVLFVLSPNAVDAGSDVSSPPDAGADISTGGAVDAASQGGNDAPVTVPADGGSGAGGGAMADVMTGATGGGGGPMGGGGNGGGVGGSGGTQSSSGSPSSSGCSCRFERGASFDGKALGWLSVSVLAMARRRRRSHPSRN